jgi:LCP family protein required for cell wall assembly
MHMRKKQQESDTGDRAAHPNNLLDLNRSLQDYAYHPTYEGADLKQPQQPITPEKPKKPWKKIAKWAVGIIIAVIIIAGGWVGWKLFANQVKIFGWGSIVDAFQKTKLKGEDDGHVTILLAGNSADATGHGGAQLTDSIMLVSINTKNNTAFMLSIPRDLYVNIPGEGYAKINEAYQDGEQSSFSESGYAKGGMGLLEKTISEHFGLPIQYYALVDYTAVRDAVNAVGGITVNITSTDPRGLYDPSVDLYNNYQPLVKLPTGTSTINGTQALGLARARGDNWASYGYALSDFTRTQNQRLIMLGLKDKVLSAGTLSNPVKLGELFDSFGNNIKTDFTLPEVRRLYDLSKTISNGSITSAGLNDVDGKNLLTGYTNKYGQSTLIPRKGIDDYSELQAFIQKLLTPATSSTSGNSSNQ